MENINNQSKTNLKNIDWKSVDEFPRLNFKKLQEIKEDKFNYQRPKSRVRQPTTLLWE